MKTLEQLIREKFKKYGNTMSIEQADDLAEKIVEFAEQGIIDAYCTISPPQLRVVTALDVKTGVLWNADLGINETYGSDVIELHSVTKWSGEDFGLDAGEPVSDILETWTTGYRYPLENNIIETLEQFFGNKV